MNEAPKHLRRFFPESLVFEKGRFMFQEKCEVGLGGWYDIPKDVKKAANSLGIIDLHAYNFGQAKDGSWKIIDLQTRASLESVRYYRRGLKIVA